MKAFLAFFLLGWNVVFAMSIRESSEAVLKRHFGNEITLYFSVYEIPIMTRGTIEAKVRQRFFRERVHFWKVTAHGEVVGYGILDNVMGKAMPITFLVLLNPEGVIVHTEIVKYRESIGGEISNPRWLQQFSNISSDQTGRLSDRIDGISGATISVNAITRGVDKVRLLFPHLREVDLSEEKNND